MMIWLIIAEDMGELVTDTHRTELTAKAQEIVKKACVSWKDILAATTAIEREYTHKPWH